MREVVAGVVFLGVLVFAAVAPAIWRDQGESAVAAASSARPRPTPLATAAVRTPPRAIFPTTSRPLEFALPATCVIDSAGRHDDQLGMTWRIQCGSAAANRAVADAAMEQGWRLLGGNPAIGVGLQNYTKGGLWMQIAFRLDGPAFADPFVIVQYVGRVQ